MIQAEILKPMAVLAMWTMIMWIWMYAVRIPAINKLPKPTEAGADQGWTGAMLETSCRAKSSGKRTITTICTKRRRYSMRSHWPWR